MKKKILEFRERFEQSLRGIFGRMTPTRRLVIIICLCTVFGVANTWIVVSAVCDIGNGRSGRAIKIEHIEGIGTDPGAMPVDTLNIKHYGNNAK